MSSAGVVDAGTNPTRAQERKLTVRDKYLLLGAVVAALAIRLAVVALVYPLFLAPEQDHWVFGYEMGHVAYSVVTGHGFADPYWGPIGLTVKVPPTYVYFMAFAFKLFGIYTKAAAIFILSVGSLWSALTCIPIFLIGRDLAGTRPAHLAAWGWVFFPPALYFGADRMWYFSLATFLLGILLWGAFRLASSTNLWAWAGHGALAGFGALTNPVILGIYPFLAGWSCDRLRRKGRGFLRPGSIGVLLVVAVIAPWLIRNYRVFHKPVFLRDDFWLEFYVGNVGNWPYRWNGSIHPSENPAELQEYIQSGELAYMANKKAQSIAYVREHPALFAQRTIRRFVYVWTGFWSIESEYTSPTTGRILNLCYFLFTVLAGVGLWQASQVHPARSALVFVVLLLFPGVYYITHIEMGYRHPLDPILLILAIHGSLYLFERSKERLTHRQTASLQTPRVEEAAEM